MIQEFKNYIPKFNKIDESIDVQGFDIELFKNMKSFNQRINYCKERLVKIGEGSSRIVYKINDNVVLKLAKNSKGLAQNESEINQGEYYDLKNIVANVYDSDEDNRWVEMELCKKITKSRFKELTGISFLDYTQIMQYEYAQNNPSKKRFGSTKPNIESDIYWENEFVKDMIDYQRGYDALVGDLCKINSYGENSKGNIILTDFGLTDNIFEEHYK